MRCYPDNTDSEDDQKPKFRECTDVLWLCVFILFWILMIFVAAVAYVYGNPVRLISGSDTFGNICGADNYEAFGGFNLSGIDMRNKPFLFFMDFNNISESLRICIKQCPDRKMETPADIRQFYRRTGSSLCRYDKNFEASSGTNSSPVNSAIGPCPELPVEKSVSVINRCVPETFVNSYLRSQNWELIDELLRDLYLNWPWILGLTMMSFMFSVVLLTLIHLLANVVSWIIMISVGLAAVAGTAVLWWTYFDIKCRLDSVPLDQEFLNEEVNNEEAFIWYSVIATIFTLLVLLLMFSIRKHISFLKALFQESSTCLSELPILYLQPVLSFLLLLAFYVFWISVVICLATASYPETKEQNLFSVMNSNLLFNLTDAGNRLTTRLESNDQIPFSLINPDSLLKNITITDDKWKSYIKVEYMEIAWLKYMIVIYLIGLIWISEFILACQHMVVAGSVAKWYFSRNTKNSTAVVFATMGNLICYHIGSLALGSLLITLLKVPRIILSYLYKKTQRNREDSDCAECAATCCTCCFCCFEKFLRYVNHNAYAIVAVQGTSFCPAAYCAFKILVNNALRLATVNRVGDFILFLAKCLVTLTATTVGVLIFKFDSTLHLFAASTLLVCIFTYFVAHSVILLYEVIIDTMFLCISQDQKANGNDGQWRGTVLATVSYRGVKTCHLPPPIELQRTF